MKKIVFLTGATGFLGTQIVTRLIEMEDIRLILLVRGRDLEDSERHLRRAWWEFPELTHELGKSENFEDGRIQVLNGDITYDKLGLENGEYDYLVENITHVIHTAADLQLNAPLENLRKFNVNGTLNVLKLALKAHKHHKIQRFTHVSTAYVAGLQEGVIKEDSLTDKYGFKSNYERSKYEGELSVKNSDLPTSIFRPGMIIGDSKSGYIKTFNTIYVLLRLYLKGKLRILPVSDKLKINLVPVDFVSDAVSKLTFDANAEGKTFHLTAPYDCLPTVKELVYFVREWSVENLDIKLPMPLFIPLSSLIPIIVKFFNVNHGIGRALMELAPYLNENREFERNNIEEFMDYSLEWRNFLPKMLSYAVYNGFFHRSTRTVHEQVLFRLKSKSWPVNYCDVVKRRFLHKNPNTIREEILKALNSLKKLGIDRGDSVAIVGHNSTRYLSLDIAIGLLGAVSVPIYYTSPVEEINEILNDCDAKALFIGIPDLLAHSNEIETKDHIISFCFDYKTDSPVITWEEFLEIGIGDPINMEDISAPVDFDDISTIRYTSGTTGKPAGVTFTHGNLRWMAEFVASMPPWKDRTHDVSYLSFLPMNHVVEGILGTYAPYYAPASLKLYFLEDFQDLASTLTKVRPSIFFSVPRFYEKIWSIFQQTWLGNMYLNMNPGSFKAILGRWLKRTLLKKAGLDECAQLIVGSAPVSEDLLKGYHELGIEVYNAYGLTEAPLVTINRLGSNRIGTVGEPLPHTGIRIGDDGEVIVKGPQVTQGYYNDHARNKQLLKDNWLKTGDYGHITLDGSLVITGRKKELIVNSYGKSISPLKIEGMLKLMNGIAEVMVVGDEKPYCIALMWMDHYVDHEDLSRGIKDANSKLSNPEKIKRWIVLKNDLSIEGGDLTASLKLKRHNILNRHENLVNMVYRDDCDVVLSNDPRVVYFGGEGKIHEH